MHRGLGRAISRVRVFTQLSESFPLEPVRLCQWLLLGFTHSGATAPPASERRAPEQNHTRSYVYVQAEHLACRLPRLWVQQMICSLSCFLVGLPFPRFTNPWAHQFIGLFTPSSGSDANQSQHPPATLSLRQEQPKPLWTQLGRRLSRSLISFRTLVWKVNCRDIYQGDNFIHMHSLIGSKLDKIAPRGRIPQISWRSCRGQLTMSQRPHLDSHLLLYCWNVTAQDAAAPAQCHLSKRSLRVPVNARLDRKHRMFRQPTRQCQLWALYWFPLPLLTSHFPFFLLPYSSSSESFLPSAEVPSFLVFENGNCSLGSIESTWLLSLSCLL